MGLFRSLLGLICVLSWFLLMQTSYQLQSSQTQLLMQLRKHLEYPAQLEIWKDHTVDFCYMSFPGQVNITCENNAIIELRISGPSGWLTHRLSDQFSMDSFVATLARLNNLRVLSLVNLGLWGSLPDKIGRLSTLEAMDLSSNFLFGSVPPKISKMEKLQTLKLGLNLFNGSLPDWSGSLSSLSVLDLRQNRLSSELPKFPKNLAMAFLNNNSLTGEIPNQYVHLSHLQQLDLSFNSLNGMPPAGIFTLKNLTSLNMAFNSLSGSFSDHLVCSSSLRLVDISNNRFQGQLPACLTAKTDNRTVNYSWNCFSVDSNDQHSVSYCQEASAVTTQDHRRKSHNAAPLVAVIAIVFTAVAILACVLLIICRKFCGRGASEQHLLHKTAGHESSPAAFSTELITNARFISDTAKLSSQVAPMCRSFSLEELKDATKNFDNSNYMGGGSNGKLYKGRLENGTQIAIRCLPLPKKYTIRNLKLRLDLLAKPRHPNLVCLLGHCIDGDSGTDPSLNKVFLIYEYVPHGNFMTHLLEENPERVLKWFDRLTILIGIAKAVHFLHTGVIPSFLNNRLKTHNILISDHRVAKLSDYGLSIISEDAEKLDTFNFQQTNSEDDIYSFGVIILEGLVGPTVTSRREEILQRKMARFDSQDGRRGLVEPVVLATSSQESLSIVVSLMNKCVSTETVNRPSFEDILWNLQYAAQDFRELEYLLVGLVSAVPSFLFPMLLGGKADANIPWKGRYWASLWIIIFSYVGNYFWTHYFFTVLGASYTFPSWRINNMNTTFNVSSHSICLLFYHVTSNMTLPRLRHAVAGLPWKVQWVAKAAWILALSYFIALLDTVAITNFPYYQFVDRDVMDTVGSLFYAIYFLVSFPMFMR